MNGILKILFGANVNPHELKNCSTLSTNWSTAIIKCFILPRNNTAPDLYNTRK